MALALPLHVPDVRQVMEFMGFGATKAPKGRDSAGVIANQKKNVLRRPVLRTGVLVPECAQGLLSGWRFEAARLPGLRVEWGLLFVFPPYTAELNATPRPSA